jgi:hypothetical protein
MKNSVIRCAVLALPIVLVAACLLFLLLTFRSEARHADAVPTPRLGVATLGTAVAQ